VQQKLDQINAQSTKIFSRKVVFQLVYLKNHVLVSSRTNKTSFFAVLRKTWDQTPKDLIKNLVESVSRRLKAVIDAKGALKKY
jgi:hypothetical protein